MPQEKIILICKETFTYPMNFIKDEIQNRNMDVHALFIHPTESILKDHSYITFIKRNKDIKISTLNEITLDYWNQYKCANNYLDHKYLKYIEDEYCQDIPFGIMMMSAQEFTTPYHYRFYFRDLTEDEKLLWVQILFKYYEKFLENIKPTRIIDLDNSTIERLILFQVAKKYNIKYVTFEYSRYDNYVLPTYTLGRITDPYIQKYYMKLYKDTLSRPNRSFENLDVFRQKEKIMLEDFKLNNTSKISKKTFYQDLKRFISILRLLIVGWKDNYNFSGIIHRKPLIAGYGHSILFHLFLIIRERILFSSFSNYFDAPASNDKYIYFPLHLIPESTTLSKSPFYPNELSVIEAISKSLPLSWVLYVKEHGAMIGERPLKFYKHIKRLSNVKFVSLSYYDDPKPWILNSIGVVTLSGTSAFEAAMLGKRAIILGNTMFEVLNGIKKIDSFKDLPHAIKQLQEPIVDNDLSCEAYLQMVKKFGKKLPILKIQTESFAAIRNNINISESLKKYISATTDTLLFDYDSL